MLHAISVQRSRCICSFWPEYLSANLWNVWCSINIKSRFGIHGCANEIWSSLFSLPICKSIYVLILDDLGYEDMLSSFYSKEKKTSIKWMNEANDVLLAWLITVFSRLCGLADHSGCLEWSGISRSAIWYGCYIDFHVFQTSFWEALGLQTEILASQNPPKILSKGLQNRDP